MGASPSSPTYRTAGRVVILLLLTMGMVAQVAKRSSISKGPRAIGLLHLLPGGKVQLVPISIMVDGKFFDANAYKATPVPMALEGGTVYEAERTGESIGLFTVTKVAQQTNSWIGEGSWRPAGSEEPSTGPKAETKPREEEDKPPTLRRGGASPSAGSQPPDAGGTKTTPTPTGTGSSTTQSSEPDDRPRLKSTAPPKDQPAAAPTQAPGASTSAPSQPHSSQPSPESAPEDPSRPTLKRGKQPTTSTGLPASTKPVKTPGAASAARPPKADAHAASSASTSPSAEIVPAISDAGGPEPRPYNYEMKPQEEQAFRNKILALAAEEVWIQAKIYDPSLATSGTSMKSPAKSKGAPGRTPQPAFDDVKLKVFDVATNNEPILVLTASASLPQRGKSDTTDQPTPNFYVTLVVHSDMYGELRKLLSVVTDDRHLDVSPRMSLVDAVDADGDGRAELLFQQIFDSGRSYVIYRVGADQLWPLYQGTPSGSQ